ncbi:MAG: low temperature requirement protein A [Actinomycetota bacterium]
MALTKWQPPVLRHSVDDEGDVVWLELYFDLIFVAALIQLGDQLADNVSWDGVFRFAAVFTLLWWVWTGTTAFMNRFAVDDITHRVLVFAQMFMVGNMALVAVSPLDDRSVWMAMAYVGARIPMIAMYFRVRHKPGSSRLTEFYRWVFTIGAGIWLVSLLVPTPFRYFLWAAALAIEFAAPLVAARKMSATPAHEEHFRERYALFTIIVLGESFVKVLSELASKGVSIESQVFGTLLFIVGAALWWTYFDDVADSTLRPGGAGRLLPWVYSHLPLTMALTALGVGGKKLVTVEAFGADIKDSYLWLYAGAIAAALAATAILDLVTVSPHFAVGLRMRVTLRLAAAVLVLLVPLFMADGAALMVVSVITVITVLQIAVELVAATKAEKRIDQVVAEHISSSSGVCERLLTAPLIEPNTENCLHCEEKGGVPVELRVCLECGHVGCCDDTEGQHARAHFTDSGHTLIASIQPGATWAYCFVHDAVLEDWRTTASAGGDTARS